MLKEFNLPAYRVSQLANIAAIKLQSWMSAESERKISASIITKIGCLQALLIAIIFSLSNIPAVPEPRDDHIQLHANQRNRLALAELSLNFDFSRPPPPGKAFARLV